MTINGGPRPIPPGTLNKLFFDAVDQYDRPNALMYKAGGDWKPISHKTFAERVRRCARGLTVLGVKPGDRIAILSENRPEWAIADYACLTSRVVDVPLYPNLPPEQRIPGKFISPHAACWDAEGNIYVVEWISDRRVTKLRRITF